MEKSEFEKQLLQCLESFTLYADFDIKDSNKKNFNKERFCFFYGAACGLRNLAIRLKIDVSFYEGYFAKLNEFVESHDILCRMEPLDEEHMFS